MTVKPPSIAPPEIVRADDTVSAKIVRLPIIPRDTAFGEGRPLSEVARLHGMDFHRWIHSRMQASGPVPVSPQALAPRSWLRRLLRL